MRPCGLLDIIVHAAAPCAYLLSLSSRCLRFWAPIRSRRDVLSTLAVKNLNACTQWAHLQVFPWILAIKLFAAWPGFGPSTLLAQSMTIDLNTALKGSSVGEMWLVVKNCRRSERKGTST